MAVVDKHIYIHSCSGLTETLRVSVSAAEEKGAASPHSSPSLLENTASNVGSQCGPNVGRVIALAGMGDGGHGGMGGDGGHGGAERSSTHRRSPRARQAAPRGCAAPPASWRAPTCIAPQSSPCQVVVGLFSSTASAIYCHSMYNSSRNIFCFVFLFCSRPPELQESTLSRREKTHTNMGGLACFSCPIDLSYVRPVFHVQLSSLKTGLTYAFKLQAPFPFVFDISPGRLQV